MAKARRDSIHDARNLPTQIDNALIDCYGAQIGAYGVAVYVALARFAKQAHATVLAYQTIADVLHIGKTTVRDTIKNLSDAGLIRVEQQTDDAGNPIASNRYTLIPIGDKKAESPHGGGAATRQGVPPHDTPLPPDDGGVPPHDRGYRQAAGGVPPHEYIDHDSILVKNLDSPPPTMRGGGGEKITATEAFLLDEGFGEQKARQFRDLDLATAQYSLRKLKKGGTENGGIIRQWERRLPQLPAPTANGHPSAPPPKPLAGTTSRAETREKLIALAQQKATDHDD